MEFFRVSRNAWGQETLLGVSWGLLWVFVGAALVFIAVHLVYKWLLAQDESRSRASTAASGELNLPERLIRHQLVDRLYHWTMAVTVLVLLGTSFLPIWGLKFPWIDAHWIAGVLLTLFVACHMVRALFWQDPRSMLIGVRDWRGMVQATQWLLRRRKEAPERPGRYPLLQKLYHHGIALFVLLILATGIAMMAKIDGPFWTRNPYLLSSDTWAAIYVVHDLAAMLVLAALIIHIYFALRPDKLWNTRAMIFGWIKRSDYVGHYDPELWRAEALDEGTRSNAAVAPGH